jgi:Raf kinase inhibitor-like YbhB/YbcL family protein
MKPAKYLLAIAALLIASNTALAEEIQPAFSLTSPDISEGQTLDADFVFKGFGCEGANVSPALKWEGAPEGTKSFAVTVYDPDAPTGSGWWHWFAFNIPSDVTELPKNTVAGKGLPGGALELANDYGATGFGGACPPPGEVHRYKFTVHALNTVLELDENVSNALAGYMVNANSIASSTITAVYHR